MNTDYPIARELFAEIWRALGGDEVWLDRVRFYGDGALPSPFAVTDFAAAVFAAPGPPWENSWRPRQRRP